MGGSLAPSLGSEGWRWRAHPIRQVAILCDVTYRHRMAVEPLDIITKGTEIGCRLPADQNCDSPPKSEENLKNCAGLSLDSSENRCTESSDCLPKNFYDFEQIVDEKSDMEESGFMDASHNTEHHADTLTITTEPVHCPIGSDGSINLATIRSALPGASGLWFYDNDRRRVAVDVDSGATKLFPPSGGWNAASLYPVDNAWRDVKSYDRYQAATKQFRDSVELVYKMLAGMGLPGVQSLVPGDEKELMRVLQTQLGAAPPPESISPNAPPPAEPMAAEPMPVERNSSEHSEQDAASQKIMLDDKDIKIRQLEQMLRKVKESNDRLRGREDQHRYKMALELEAAQSQVAELLLENEKLKNAAGQADGTAQRVPELEGAVAEATKRADDAQWRLGELTSECDGKQSAIDDLNNRLADVQKCANDAQWRVGELESEMGTKNGIIDDLNGQLQRANDATNEANARCDDVQRELDRARAEAEGREIALSAAEHLVDQLQAKLEQDKHTDEQAVVEEPMVQAVAVQQESAAPPPGENGAGNGDELRARVNTLSQRKAQLKAELAHQKNANQEMKDRLDQLHNVVDEIGRLRERTSQLESDLGEANKRADGSQWRVGELEADVNAKQAALDDLAGQLAHVQKELDEANARCGEAHSRLRHVEQQLHHSNSGKNGTSEDVERRASVQADELSGELRRSAQRKFELEAQCKELSSKLDKEQKHSGELQHKVHKLEEELWAANERKAHLEGEVDGLRGACGDKDNHINWLQGECDAKHQRILELENQLSPEPASEDAQTYVKQLEEQLWLANERKAQLEPELHRAHATCGDKDNHINWLQGECDAKHERILELEHMVRELNDFKGRVHRQLSQGDAFLIRKEPYVDRNKWTLSMLESDDKVEDSVQRVWFELDAPHSRQVYLTGSFTNWECAMMCTMHPHGKHGVWLDLPRGRYEFRFYVDGEWRTSEQYDRCANDWGSDNNWRVVE